jgi:hypothetical protein
MSTVKALLQTAMPTLMPSKGELVVVPPAPPTLAEHAANIRTAHGKAMSALADSLTAAIAAGDRR